MGRVASAGDNAAMESFFALLQTDVLDRRRWRPRDELRYAIIHDPLVLKRLRDVVPDPTNQHDWPPSTSNVKYSIRNPDFTRPDPATDTSTPRTNVASWARRRGSAPRARPCRGPSTHGVPQSDGTRYIDAGALSGWGDDASSARPPAADPPGHRRSVRTETFARSNRTERQLAVFDAERPNHAQYRVPSRPVEIARSNKLVELVEPLVVGGIRGRRVQPLHAAHHLSIHRPQHPGTR